MGLEIMGATGSLTLVPHGTPGTGPLHTVGPVGVSPCAPWHPQATEPSPQWVLRERPLCLIVSPGTGPLPTMGSMGETPVPHGIPGTGPLPTV